MLWQDVRTALRSLLRARVFTATAVAVVALGVGATSAVFALVDAALMRPLPFVDPDRLVMLWERPPAGTRNRVSPLNFQDWSEQNHTFASMAAIAGFSRVLTRDGRAAERISGQSVTTAFFDVLGIQPVAGRTFRRDDARPDADVVVVSERFWRAYLGGDASAIGRTITLDSVPTTVIGVVPSRFQILFPADLWSPFPLRRTPEQRRQHYLQVIGRLGPDRTIEDARADMELVADAIARIAPDTNKNWRITIEPLRDGLVGRELRTTAFVFGALVLFVLLMACGNVANLLLARGVSRSRELATRAAIGASAWQVARLLVVESAIVATAGGVAGVAVAWTLLTIAPAIIPPDMLPTGIVLQFDARVAVAAAACAGLAGVLSGVSPARQAARTSLVEALAAGGRAGTPTGGTRRALAVAQVAGAVLLLSAAALMMRTLVAMRDDPVGFHADSVVALRLVLPFNRYRDESSLRLFYRRVEAAVGALPGVRSVGLGNLLPLDGVDIGQPISIAGDPPADPSGLRGAQYVMVSAQYFDTLGIAILGGRRFDAHDSTDGAPVCIVNEEFVRRFLRGRNPLASVVNVPAMAPGQAPAIARRIVGIASQVAVAAGSVEQTPAIYVPFEQNAWYSMAVAIRTVGDPWRSVEPARAAIASIDPNLPATQVRTLDEIAAMAVMRPRFRAALVGAFATIATTLAGVGIFSVLMFAVRERTREFGVRRALGATRVDIVREVGGAGVRLAAIGAAAGLAAAAATTRLLSSLLYGVAPLDPVSFLAAAAALAAVAVGACVAPALAASRVDPATALRYP